MLFTLLFFGFVALSAGVLASITTILINMHKGEKQ
jgi:hypothetical protein